MSSSLDLGFIRDEMKRPTKRDLQVKVGASNLGNPCTRCLADDLLATESSGGAGPYWLASWLGTGAHERFEKSMPGRGWLKERRLSLFEIDGYGEVESTTDLYLEELEAVVDYKTTTRAKLRQYKRVLDNGDESESLLPARYTLERYLNQTDLYGLGCENQGLTVKHSGMFFLCRDGTGDNDIWWHTREYDRERALTVKDRADRLWAYLREGGSPEDLTQYPGCWYCLNKRGVNGPRKSIEREEIDL